jgi:DNA-binding transcriptional LysR family regulator
MSKKSARPALDRLRIRHCRLLEMLAAHESLRKAASQMGVSQPVASQMLAEIEAAFGVTLFTRSRNGLRATARLPLILRHIRNIVNELDAACDEMSSSGGRRIRIGANLQFLMQLLPAALAELEHAALDVTYRVREGPSDELVQALVDGELDCVIARLSTKSIWSSRRAEELQFWPLVGGELCIVAGRSHPLANKKRLSIEDLASARWALGMDGGQGREALNRVFIDAGVLPPRPLIECRPQSANLALVAQMQLISIATRVEAAAAQKAGWLRILPFDIAINTAPLAFICKKSAREDDALKLLRSALIKHAGKSRAAGLRARG